MGAIHGALKVRPLPREIAVETLRLRQQVPKEDALRGAMKCPVDEKGGWSCQLPAAVFDLRLSVPGFAPEYRLATKVPAADALDLGTLVPKVGASIAGWAESPEGSPETEDCMAHLIPLGTPEEVPARASARVTRGGFFQITDVAPGKYLLEVKRPGFLPAKLSPIEVPSTTWATLLEHPLVLRRQTGMGSLPPPK
jgi:hypothetical protein